MWEIIEPMLERVGSFSNLFFSVCRLLSTDCRALFGMIMRRIWKNRNAKLWEQKEEGHFHVVQHASHELEGWINAMTLKMSMHTDNTPIHCSGWKKPPQGFIKCNLDAAFFSYQNKTGYGICFRNDQGQFLMAITGWYKPLLMVHEGEAYALLQAIRFAMEFGLQNVTFELDCKMVADSINQYSEHGSEYGAIIQECRYTLFTKPDLKVQFVRRQANVVAHSLARVATSYTSPQVFMDTPNCIAVIISLEMK